MSRYARSDWNGALLPATAGTGSTGPGRGRHVGPTVGRTVGRINRTPRLHLVGGAWLVRAKATCVRGLNNRIVPVWYPGPETSGHDDISSCGSGGPSVLFSPTWRQESDLSRRDVTATCNRRDEIAYPLHGRNLRPEATF
ncbi:unnamed protein product [Protopolystoma xenopodis]|uniref:Uncharacterized protein n=1 Tax=Protopolystoma xenopodis TaxID=117903 RepID=A0A3S5A769_9PLAT|nr:unnamed protein product [Protopolystoma xenopodis]